MDPWRCIPVLIFLTFFCAVVELGIKSIYHQTPTGIKRLFPEENEKSKKMLEIIEKDAFALMPAKTAVIFFITAAVSVGVATFGKVFCGLSCFKALNDLLSVVLSQIIVFIILFMTVILFAKVIPAKIAKKYTDFLSIRMFGFVKIISSVFMPLYAPINFLGDLISRIAGVSAESVNEDVTEDEIRHMIDEGREHGSIEESETDMIHSIFEFNDREVGEILTHRTDITAVEVSDSLDEVIEAANVNGFSRIPVYKETLDDVVGILYVKDLLRLVEDEKLKKEFRVSDYMRNALYVPETNSLKELFEKFKNERIQMAVVIDEYGGTLGIVTMEDLIESIMGSICDEYDEEEDKEIENIISVSENEYIVNGLASIKEVEESIGCTIKNPENCETVGGLAVSLMGMIPGENDHPEVDIGNITLRVLSMQEHRVEKLYLSVKGIDDNEDDDEDETEQENKNSEST